MSGLRAKRLHADQQRIEQGFARHEHIRVVKTSGSPPDRYQVEFRIKGLTLNGDRVVLRDRHLAEIYLTTGYPRQAPQCRMLTPCFHPNIDPNAICVGDHWAAGESLANLLVRIGEMIAFQSYNTKSPLNGEAARWVDENRDKLPIDKADLRPEALAHAETAAVAAPTPATAGAPPATSSAASAPPASSTSPSGAPIVPKARLLRVTGPTNGASAAAAPAPGVGGAPHGSSASNVTPYGVPAPGPAGHAPPGRLPTPAASAITPGVVPKARLIRATPASPGGPSPNAPPPAAVPIGGDARTVDCACGRRYRPKHDRPFRCLGCGAALGG